jgi:hypothetical protein
MLPFSPWRHVSLYSPVLGLSWACQELRTGSDRRRRLIGRANPLTICKHFCRLQALSTKPANPQQCC